MATPRGGELHSWRLPFGIWSNLGHCWEFFGILRSFQVIFDLFCHLLAMLHFRAVLGHFPGNLDHFGLLKDVTFWAILGFPRITLDCFYQNFPLTQNSDKELSFERGGHNQPWPWPQPWPSAWASLPPLPTPPLMTTLPPRSSPARYNHMSRIQRIAFSS